MSKKFTVIGENILLKKVESKRSEFDATGSAPSNEFEIVAAGMDVKYHIGDFVILRSGEYSRVLFEDQLCYHAVADDVIAIKGRQK